MLLSAQSRSRWSLSLAIGLLGVLGSCSANSDTVCGANISFSDYVAGFSQGLDNFSDDRYAQLRTESNSAYDRTVFAVADDFVTAEATAISSKISAFIRLMETVEWDVNRALDIPEAVEAAVDLGSELTLRQANAVEGELVKRCGMPSSVAPLSDEGVVTLPRNPIPSPTATDPTTKTVSDISELSVIGKMIANQFGLTVSDSEGACLGTSLSGIYDASGPETNNAQYQRQFQRAFDACGIVFFVPDE